MTQVELIFIKCLYPRFQIVIQTNALFLHVICRIAIATLNKNMYITSRNSNQNTYVVPEGVI